MIRAALTALDAVALAGFGVAFWLLLVAPTESASRFVRPVRYFGLAALALLVSLSGSDLLAQSGVAPVLTESMERLEVLFIPLIVFIVYSVATAQELEEATTVQQRLSEEHSLLETVVDVTPAGIMLLHPDLTVSLANDVARELLDLRDMGLPGRHYVPDGVGIGFEPGRWEPAGEALMALADEGPAYNVVRFVDRPGRGELALDISVKPLADMMAGGCVVAFVDVTDSFRRGRDLERAVEVRTRELLDANEGLRRASGARQEFLARMSHELRTPLNSIIGFSGVMLSGRAGAVSDEQATQLKMIKRSGEHLLELVNQILDMSVIEAGKARPVHALTDVCSLTEHIVTTLQPEASERGVGVRFTCPVEAERVVTDADKVGQIIRNLTANAVDFTDPGGEVDVHVAVERDQLVLIVADTGVGIPDEDVERIFEPFEQARSSEGRRTGGTGLGLAICRELVALLGGEISVVSRVGSGSTFTARLPLGDTRAGESARAVPGPGRVDVGEEPSS